MNKLSLFDFFVYGALVARTENTTAPTIISKNELCSITGLSELQIITSIKKLHLYGFLVVIWFGDDAHLRLDPMIPELIEVAGAIL